MRKILVLTFSVLLSGCLAFAGDDYPNVETFLGFTFMRANSATDIPAFSTNGGGGQFAVNFNKWMGFVTDIGAVHNGNISDISLDTTFTNYLFGPRVTFRSSRIAPYLQVLAGGMHGSSSIQLSAVPVGSTQPVLPPGFPPPRPGDAVTLRATTSQTAFAWSAGGGFDIKVNNHWSFRVIGLDYVMTRLQNVRSLEDNNQHHLRYTTGVNFTFGAR